MGCSEFFLKIFLFLTNLVVTVVGTALLAGGIVFSIKQFDFFPDLKDYSINVNSVLIPVIITGAALLVVGLLGCWGAAAGNSKLLNLYFLIVFLIIILEVAVIALGVVKKDDFVEQAQDFAKELFGDYRKAYVEQDGSTLADNKALAVNSAQFVFQCCGLVDGPSFWKKSERDSSYTVPPGCCNDWNGKDMTAPLVTCADKTFEKSCTDKINDLGSKFGMLILAGIVVVIVFEILCLVAACYSKNKGVVA